MRAGGRRELFGDESVTPLHEAAQGAHRELDRLATTCPRRAHRRRRATVDRAIAALRAGGPTLRESRIPPWSPPRGWMAQSVITHGEPLRLAVERYRETVGYELDPDDDGDDDLSSDQSIARVGRRTRSRCPSSAARLDPPGGTVPDLPEDP